MKKRVFDQMTNFLFPIRKKFDLDADDGREFDFPNYGGLSKNIIEELSPEAVDAMQDILYNLPKINRKRDFQRQYKQRLIELGERVQF